MAIGTETQTDRRLLLEVLREVREVRAIVEPRSHSVKLPKKTKKLPKWLQDSLDDEKAGRVSGPFNTVEELMADLNDPGK